MLIEIKKWTDESVIHSGEFESVKVCLEDGVKRGVSFKYADLVSANLTRANLTRADLVSANLTRANLTRADLVSADLTRANLTRANLTRANLTRANLWDADLTRADLTRADLTDAMGNREELITIQTHLYTVVLHPKEKIIQIGCKNHTASKWFYFNDREISKMDGDALEFWKSYKDLIFKHYELCGGEM